MSFPTIPNIDPSINLNREDMINLLLYSVALEQISISKLIDAEVKKILVVLEKGGDEICIRDLLDTNNSVRQTVVDAIKLEMLLQFKLEDILSVTSTTSTTTTTTGTTTTTSTSTSTSSSTTTMSATCTHTKTVTFTTTATFTTTKSSTCSSTARPITTATKSTTTTTATKTTSFTTTVTATKTTTSTTSLTATTTRRKCACSLTGKRKGRISNHCDAFSGGVATIQTCISSDCSNIHNSSLSYSVHNDTATEILIGSPRSFKIDCITTKEAKMVIIKGFGEVIKKVRGHRDITCIGSFELRVWNTGGGVEAEGFQMVITVDERPDLNHNSGKVYKL